MKVQAPYITVYQVPVDSTSNIWSIRATRFYPGGALASHEPTSARKQKRFWRKPWTESVNVIDIGVYELTDTECVEKECSDRGSGAGRGAARLPLSGDNPDGKVLLRASEGTVGVTLGSRGRCLADESGAALNPLSGRVLEGDAEELWGGT
ncbi:hypothetical protein ON010_g14002 [Phytophthora cinnamomi]|nr:hypothetical protein ON010_g14002 [Phytophthora cinnamomi]